jgi:hypothetical protein
MKTLKMPAIPQEPRQLSLMFDTRRTVGLGMVERNKVALALAQILMQAAGLVVEELDDDSR